MGIPKDHFVDQATLDDVLCPICQDVLDNPVSCLCADEHAFCEDCITNWLTDNQCCPLDIDSVLSVPWLTTSPENLVQKLSSLKIKSDLDIEQDGSLYVTEDQSEELHADEFEDCVANGRHVYSRDALFTLRQHPVTKIKPSSIQTPNLLILLDSVS